jgi:hypothetical protein
MAAQAIATYTINVETGIATAAARSRSFSPIVKHTSVPIARIVFVSNAGGPSVIARVCGSTPVFPTTHKERRETTMPKKRTQTPESEPTAKTNETRREKFLRLAPPRTEAALKRVELLGNLASPGYEYEPAEAQQILDALFDAVHDLKRKFEKAKAGKKSGFTFKAGKSTTTRMAV